MADRKLYRSLLRLARDADKHPQQLVTLLGWPSLVFDRTNNKVVRQTVCESPLAEDAIWEACGSSMEFAVPGGRAAAAIRKHKRRIDAVGFNYCAEAEHLLNRFHDARSFASRVLSAATTERKVTLPPLELEFISGARAGKKIVLGQRDADVAQSGKMSLTRPQNAITQESPSSAFAMPELQLSRLTDGSCQMTPVRWLKPLALHHRAACDTSSPSFSEVLIAHPLTGLDWTKPSLDQAVLLLSHVCEERDFVKGVIINKPARGTLRNVLAAWSCRTGDGGLVRISQEDQMAVEALGPLLDATILTGGDVMSGSLSDSITWLHTVGEVVPGAKPVIPSLTEPSLWIGGDVSILAGLVASGQVDLKRVRPIVGHCGWSRPQLELELKRGVWVRAQCSSSDVALRLCMASLPCLDDVSALERHRTAAWRAALRAAKLLVLAEFPRNQVVDEVLRKILAQHYRGKKKRDKKPELNA